MAKTIFEGDIYSVEIVKNKNQIMILSSGKEFYNKNRIDIHLFSDLNPYEFSSKLYIINLTN